MALGGWLAAGCADLSEDVDALVASRVPSSLPSTEFLVDLLPIDLDHRALNLVVGGRGIELDRDSVSVKLVGPDRIEVTAAGCDAGLVEFDVVDGRLVNATWDNAMGGCGAVRPAVSQALAELFDDQPTVNVAADLVRFESERVVLELTPARSADGPEDK